MRRTVGIRAAKARLSELVRAAERGDTVTITDRGRVVARLGPATDASLTAEESYVDLERRGWLAPLAGPRPGPVPPLMKSRRRGAAQRLLAEDRAGR